MRATSGFAMSGLQRLRLGLLWMLLGSLAACAPTYELALRPARPMGLLIEGREQTHAYAADSVEVRLSFVRYEADRLVFEAEYRNPSSRPVVVEPAAFAYAPARVPAPPHPAGARAPKPPVGLPVTATAAARRPLSPLPLQVRAFNPEAMLADLDATTERAERKAGNAATLSLVFTLLTVAADVASITTTDTPAKAQSMAAVREGLAATSIAATASSISNAVVAEVSRDEAGHLTRHALRQVTLAPGQQVYGLLYFPRTDTADTLRLLAPLPGGPAPVDFVQTRRRE